MNRTIVLTVLMTILPFRLLPASSPSLAAQPRVQPPAYTLRFSDVAPNLSQHANHLNGSRPHAEASALPWLKQHGWEKVWPRFGMGKDQPLVFAGPKKARYLRLDADDAYYIWTKPLKIDVEKWPILEIKWGVDRFADEAALDVHGRSDRPLVIIVSFGDKLAAANPLFPRIPRGLAFFWGETETIGQSYTCIKPRIGPADVRMLCRYPHVHYIALRRNQVGSVHTEHVNLVEHFKRYFLKYWQAHRRIPPVVGISFEAGTTKTHTFSQSRLYALRFLKTAPAPQTTINEGP